MEGCTTDTTDPTPLQFKNFKPKTKLQALDGQRNESRGGFSDF